jgi:hypothetical protein
MRNTLFYQRLRLGLSAAAFIGAMFGPGVQSAFATGTQEGTTISNLSTLNYSVGGVGQTAIGSSATGNTSGAGTATTFLVDAKINLNVLHTDAAIVSVVPGQTTAAAKFSVTNSSNVPSLDFALAIGTPAAASAGPFGVGSSNFPVSACSAYADTNTNGVYDAGTDVILPNSSGTQYIDELAVDTSKTVFVVCTIPASATDTQTGVVALTATARGNFTGANGIYVSAAGLGSALTQTAGANTANVDIVYADGIGVYSDDGSRDAAFSDRDSYKVVSAVISVQKTVSALCDPLNLFTNPKQIPLGYVKWAIVISNTGSAAATLSTVGDPLDGNTTFDANLIKSGTTCDSSGTPESGAGKGFKVSSGGTSTRATATTPAFYTTANDTDGADLNGTTVNIDYSKVLPVEGTYTAGQLKPGESVTVFFNSFVK